MRRYYCFFIFLFLANTLFSQSCSQSPITASASNLNISSGQASILTYISCTGGKVVWTAGTSNASLTSLSVTPTATTTYKATCTYSATDVCSSSVTVTVNPTCLIEALANKTAIVKGESINLSVSGTSCPTGTVSWRDSEGNSIQSLTVSPQNNINYIALCSYPNGQTCSDDIAITVTPACFIDAFSSESTIVSGESTTLASSGCEGGVVSWKIAGGSVFTNLTVGPLTATTTYTATCTYPVGTPCTDNVTVTVIPVCTISTATATPAQITAGNSSTLVATGCTNGNISWIDQQNNTISTQYSVNVSPTITTTYKFVCSYSSVGNFCNKEVTVVVNGTCSITGSSTTIDAGQSTLLTYTGCTNGQTSWKNGSAAVTSLVVTPTATTTYTVTCTQGTNTCTSNATITVNPSCGIAATATNLAIISGQSTTLNYIGCTGINPVWKNGSTILTGINPTVSPTSSTSYNVTCTTTSPASTCTSTILITVFPACAITASATALNISTGQSTSLTNTGCTNGFVVWQDANNAVLNNLGVSPTTTTTYKATCNYPGISTNCTSNVTINVFPVCNIIAKTSKFTLPSGQQATLSNTGCASPGVVSWRSSADGFANPFTNLNVSPTVNTTYKATCTYGTGSGALFCESLTNIVVIPACNIAASASVTTITAGQSVTLSHTGCVTGNVRWKEANGNYLSNLTFKPSATQIYTATCSYNGFNSCSSTVTVTVNYTIAFGTITSTKPTCGDGNNATILVPISRAFAGTETSTKLTLSLGTTVTGTYFTNTNSFAEIKNLKPGSYTLKLDVVNGSSVTTVNGTHNISNNDVLAFTESVIDVKCFGGADGEIKLTATGGKTPYSYDVGTNTYKLFDAQTIANLKQQKKDSLFIQVKDAIGCVSEIKNVKVKQPSKALLATLVSQLNPLGFETRDGQATISIAGGTPDYTFEWTDSTNTSYGKGVTTNVTTNKNSTLRGGTYTVKVFDKNYSLAVLAADKAGCTTIKTVKLVEPPQLKIAFTPDRAASCSDRADGKFSVILTGGVPFETGLPYKFVVKHKTIDFQDLDKTIFDNVPGGVYSMTITDKNNISRTLEYTLPNPTAIVPVVTNLKNALCYSDNKGSFELNVTGGTGPYTATWNNNLKGLALNNLKAGKYIGVVYDSKLCDMLVLAEIKQPQKLDVVLDINKPLCADSCNGTLKATIIGGTQPYSFVWADGNKTGLSFSKLCHESVQTLNVTDANECKTSITNSMPSLKRLVIPIAKENVICKDSKILLDATTPNTKTYQWTSPTNKISTNPQLIPSEIGLYKILLKDANNCEFKSTISVNSSNIEVQKLMFTSPSVVAKDENFIMVNLLNPLPNKVQWIIPAIAKDVKLSNTEAYLNIPKLGQYELGMQASFAQCEAYTTTKLTVNQFSETKPASAETVESANIIVGANPNKGRFGVKIEFKEATTFVAEIWETNNNNSLAFEFSGQGNNNYSFDVDLSDKPNGTYLLLIRTNSTTLNKKIMIVK